MERPTDDRPRPDVAPLCEAYLKLIAAQDAEESERHMTSPQSAQPESDRESPAISDRHPDERA